MSYDFRLFKRKAGEAPIVTARADSTGPATTPVEPQSEALKRRIANALIARNPELEVFPFDYEAIAKLQKISVEEARTQFRHLELNGPEDEPDGIQITLFDHEASVTVPYWHEGEGALETFRKIWSYLEIISREGDYLVYDPQLDQIIEPSAGIEAAVKHYTGVTDQIQQKLPEEGAQQKPWWRFW